MKCEYCIQLSLCGCSRKSKGDCTHKTIGELIERIKSKDYSHHTDNGGYYMTPEEVIDVVEQTIKEYCGIEG